jgi:hypothetical protein
VKSKSRRLWCKVRSGGGGSPGFFEGSDQVASTAFQSSGALAERPPNSPGLKPMRLNSLQKLDAADCHAALSNRLKPSMGLIRCLVRRWSCSILLLRCLLDRTRTRRSSLPTRELSLNSDTSARTVDDLPVKMPPLGEIGCCHACRHDRPRLESHS